MKAGIKLSLDQVRDLIDKFYDYFEGLMDWQNQVVTRARNVSYTQTALGRRRYLEKILGERNPWNKIRNFPIQGTASDGFKTALFQLDREFRELGLDAHLVLTLHDEILVEVKEDEIDEVQRIIGDCLRDAFKELVPEMSFELDMRIAGSWGN